MENGSKTCESCCHFLFTEKLFGQTAYRCRLTNAFLTGKPCNLYNKDLDEYDICLNCRYFLGGGDWGLSCAKHYHRLPEALDKSCKDMERGDCDVQ